MMNLCLNKAKHQFIYACPHVHDEIQWGKLKDHLAHERGENHEAIAG
jgi:hypothetical protein